MSELTPCCLCVLKDIKQSARRRGLEVAVKPSDSSIGGFDVYVHPPDEEIDTDKHFRAWLGGLSESCCC
jgi:hypothetical protein